MDQHKLRHRIQTLQHETNDIHTLMEAIKRDAELPTVCKSLQRQADKNLEQITTLKKSLAALPDVDDRDAELDALLDKL